MTKVQENANTHTTANESDSDDNTRCKGYADEWRCRMAKTWESVVDVVCGCM